MRVQHESFIYSCLCLFKYCLIVLITCTNTEDDFLMLPPFILCFWMFLIPDKSAELFVLQFLWRFVLIVNILPDPMLHILLSVSSHLCIFVWMVLYVR